MNLLNFPRSKEIFPSLCSGTAKVSSIFGGAELGRFALAKTASNSASPSLCCRPDVNVGTPQGFPKMLELLCLTCLPAGRNLYSLEKLSRFIYK